MVYTFLEYILAFEAILLAIITTFGSIAIYRQKVSSKKMEARAEVRQRESAISMRFMSDSLRLGVATADAVKNGKPNGKMESAVKAAEETEKEYRLFIEEMASKKIAK